MKLKRQSKFHHEVSTGALNDIMFFLLLFFLIVATVANPQVIKLTLPKSGSPDKNLTKQPVTLSVTADKKYYIAKNEVAFDNLEEELQSAIGDVPDPTVVLRLDRDLDVQSMVEVLELGMRMQVRMVLQTSIE
ncbi:MAG: biopolymer transporter ExbD [Bacteroidia bacterium]